MTTNRGKAAERAAAVETELASCPPEERPGVLIEAGEWWHAAGNNERAVELFTEAVAAGGETGSLARVAYARLLFDRGDDAEAQATLAHLRTNPVDFPSPYEAAGHLLSDREELDQALEWYDLAVERLSEQHLAAYEGDDDYTDFVDVEGILEGRYEVRRELGLPVDRFDELVRGEEIRAAEEAVELALDAEDRAEKHPEHRAELLLEAAEAWQQAGELDRAAELCTEVIGFGGQEGQIARLGLASIWFNQERDDDARAMLEAVLADGPPYALVYQAGAELYAEIGDLDQALVWYDRAYEQLMDQDQSGQLDDEDFVADAHEILIGRSLVREDLGLERDELDQAASALLQGDAEYFDRQMTGEVRVPVWQRDELPLALAAFPGVFDKLGDEELFREYEVFCRTMSASGVPTVTLVPLKAAALADFVQRTGGTVGDVDTHQAFADELAEEGDLISWPPPRNEPCWCGSAVKYKKCCGRPDLS